MLGGTGERRGERSGRGERHGGERRGERPAAHKPTQCELPCAVVRSACSRAVGVSPHGQPCQPATPLRRVPDPSKYTDANAKYRGPCCKGTRHAGRGGLTKCICKEKVSWFTQCTFCGAKIPPKTEAERNLLRLKGEMGKTSAEALSIVRGAQVDGWRAVLD